MNMNKKFDDILNECLERIIKGETVESCLKIYPELAKELEPLLKTALSARVMSSIQPKPEFKVRARSEFQAALREIQSKKTQKVSRFSWLQWRPAWSIAATTAAVVVIALGSTVAAAGNSMPNDVLYSLKIASENVQLAVTPSEIGKAELNAKFADKRVDEIIQMASTGTTQEVLTAANNLSVNTSNMAEIAGVEAASTNGMMNAYDSVKTNEPGPLMSGAITASSVPANPDQTTSPSFANENSTVLGVVPVPSSTSFTPEHGSERAKFFDPNSGEYFDSQSQLDAFQSAEKVGQGLGGNPGAAELEKIREIITNNYIKRQGRLEEALGKVSLEMRPAVLQALDQSTFEYEEAIRNIDLALISK
jgi:hypothetical protein